LTNEGKKIFRELLRGVVTVNIRGRKVLFEIQLGHLIDKEEVLAKKMERAFKVGTVSEAIQNNLFGGKIIFSPELTPILKINNQIYIYRRNPLKLLESLRSTDESIEDLFKELERTELRPLAKYLEILGMRRLFTELERQNLLEKRFPHRMPSTRLLKKT